MKSLLDKFLIAVILILACSSTYAIPVKPHLMNKQLTQSYKYQKMIARQNAARIADVPSPTRVAGKV